MNLLCQGAVRVGWTGLGWATPGGGQALIRSHRPVEGLGGWGRQVIIRTASAMRQPVDRVRPHPDLNEVARLGQIGWVCTTVHAEREPTSLTDTTVGACRTVGSPRPHRTQSHRFQPRQGRYGLLWPSVSIASCGRHGSDYRQRSLGILTPWRSSAAGLNGGGHTRCSPFTTFFSLRRSPSL